MALVGSEKTYTVKFFIISQILLLLSIYAMYDEFFVRRPWKEYQAEFKTLQMSAAEKDFSDIKKSMQDKGVPDQIKAFNLLSEAVAADMESSAYRDLQKKYQESKIRYDDFELNTKNNKSVLDNRYYEYQHALLHGMDYSAQQKEYEELNKKVKDDTAQLAKDKVLLTTMQSEIDHYAVTKFFEHIDDMLKRKDELKLRPETVTTFQAYIADRDKDGVKDPVKEIASKLTELNKPLADAQTKIDNIHFRIPEIRQIVVDDLGKGDNIYWGRVDRCMTCHVNTDKAGFEDIAKSLELTVVKDETEKQKTLQAKPELKSWVVTEDEKTILQTLYGTHPRTQELLGKHPVEQFGCTACHGGDGRGLNIQGPVFGEGDKAHAFHHHAMESLLRGKQMESNCLSCHMGEIEVSGAKNLTKGLELFVQLGCQDCHAVKGYDKLFRVGPELNKVGSKDQTSWIVDWLKNPFNYMPNSRMPNFGFSDDEVVALASYLIANSEPHKYQNQMALNGDVHNGEKLFNTVGCLACHAAKSDDQTYSVRARGPNLARLSAKIQSPQWVYDWIKNPKNYSEHARMPNLRLSDGEASDITAYLMNLNPDYKNEIQKRSGALAKRVDSHNQELIAQGKQIINNRGCYSCHLLKGFETGERIGPDLTKEALKENFELDFGDALKEGRIFTDEFGRRVFTTHMEETAGESAHDINAKALAEVKKLGIDKQVDVVTNLTENWQSWVRNKIKYPHTIYKHERAELKMPSFNLSEDEMDSLLVFLKSLTNRNIPASFNAAMRDRYQRIIAGQQLVAEKNCLGCHTIMGFGGDITAKIDAVDNAQFGAITAHYPPELTYVGMKIRPEWLASYIKDPSLKYRPAEYVRMPTFSFDDTQANTLIDYFAAMANVTPKLTSTDYHLDQTYIDAGKQMVMSDGKLICSTCHFIDGKHPNNQDMSAFAPEWKLIRARLQSDFIVQWIKDPQHFQMHTPMPGFLNDPDPTVADVLGGDSVKQLEALRQYILSIGDKRTYDEMQDDYPNTMPNRGGPVAPVVAPAVETGGGVN